MNMPIDTKIHSAMPVTGQDALPLILHNFPNPITCVLLLFPHKPTGLSPKLTGPCLPYATGHIWLPLGTHEDNKLGKVEAR